MKNLSRALAFSAGMALAGLTAISAHASATSTPLVAPPQASLDTTVDKPQLQTPFASASRVEDAGQVNVALLQSGCDDPDPWYMFSGIQAMTCLLSGQW